MDAKSALAQLREVWNELDLTSRKPVTIEWASRVAAAMETLRQEVYAAAGVSPADHETKPTGGTDGT